MSTETDASFFKTVTVVLGLLVVFTLFIMAVANMYSPASPTDSDPLIAAQTKGRIMPIGSSRVAE